MAYDAYGDADIFSFSLFCLGGILTAHILGGFLNCFMQMRFVITTVIAQVLLTTSMFAILLATEAETTGASQTPQVDWRLIPATVLLLFVLILTALALACSTRMELLPTLTVCSGVLFLGLMSDWLFLERSQDGTLWASFYTIIPNWQNLVG